MLGGRVIRHEVANLGFRLGPQAAGAALVGAAQFREKAPIAQRFTPESAFGHAMLSNERFNFGDECLHGDALSRVITRMSTGAACDYTILREIARASIILGVSGFPEIDLERLKADMADEVARTSGRAFSRKVTNGRNPSFYQNFLEGQDKRMTAEIFLGIVHALGRQPTDYVSGFDSAPVPSEAVLTATFAVMLDHLGLDPNADGRAHKLAVRFPATLRRMQVLAEDVVSDDGSAPGEAAPALAEGPPAP